nr:hypothetical protein [Haladaptatus sp. R4]
MDENTLTMTPGPTAVPEDVREAMAKPAMNPDVNPEFASYYETLLDKLARVYGTDDDVVVLGGEGILGLETAVESLVSPGEDVLCLANGLYGDGFADFVEMAGATRSSTISTTPRRSIPSKSPNSSNPASSPPRRWYTARRRPAC